MYSLLPSLILRVFCRWCYHHYFYYYYHRHHHYSCGCSPCFLALDRVLLPLKHPFHLWIRCLPNPLERTFRRLSMNILSLRAHRDFIINCCKEFKESPQKFSARRGKKWHFPVVWSVLPPLQLHCNFCAVPHYGNNSWWLLERALKNNFNKEFFESDLECKDVQRAWISIGWSFAAHWKRGADQYVHYNAMKALGLFWGIIHVLCFHNF